MTNLDIARAIIRKSVFRRKHAVALSVVGVALMLPSMSFADNPIVQTNYTADPAPMVYDGRLYVYTSHDEDVTVDNFFTMNDWRLYSTADVVNWTDHGSPLSYKSFSWSSGKAWAGQCIPRNGKFYYYVPLQQTTGAQVIGVAVATSPTGPFTDALNKPLVTTGSDTIDPTVFIDADGQAYLYWGNPNLWYVKLNEDMISYSGTPTKVSLTTAGFGTRSNTDRATAYEEGPWFYKRGALYYIVYPGDGVPENISYTTSSGPLGPWTFRGVIMDKETGAGSSFTNHPGVVDFGGNSYFFYHNGALPGGGGYKRSVSVEKFTYNADGTIPKIPMTTAGPAGVGNLNPYVTTEAETIAWGSGIETESCGEGGMDVTSINNGDYIKVKGVDFGAGATSFEARVASATSGGSIELRLNSATGTLVGTCAVTDTGGLQTWSTKTCSVSGATGIHDLFLKFTGGSGNLFNFNAWKFTGSGSGGGTSGTGGAGGAGGTSTGGNANAGGSRTTGGSTASGGSAATGGGIAVGGAKASGGATNPPTTGGVSNLATGGGPSTGGTANAGGSTGTSMGGSVTASGGNASSGRGGEGGATATGGGSLVTGGQISSSGASALVGGTGAAAMGDATKVEGCSCRVAGTQTPSKSLAMLGALYLLSLRMARRRSNGSVDRAPQARSIG